MWWTQSWTFNWVDFYQPFLITWGCLLHAHSSLVRLPIWSYGHWEIHYFDASQLLGLPPPVWQFTVNSRQNFVLKHRVGFHFVGLPLNFFLLNHVKSANFMAQKPQTHINPLVWSSLMLTFTCPARRCWTPQLASTCQTPWASPRCTWRRSVGTSVPCRAWSTPQPTWLGRLGKIFIWENHRKTIGKWWLMMVCKLRSVKLQFCRRWQAGTKSLTSLTALQSRARLRSRCARHVMLDWRRCTPQQNVGTWRHLWVWLGGRIPNKSGMSSVDHVDSRSRDPWGDRLVPFWIQKTHENTERERECMYPVDFHLNLSADDQFPGCAKPPPSICRSYSGITGGWPLVTISQGLSWAKWEATVALL